MRRMGWLACCIGLAGIAWFSVESAGQDGPGTGGAVLKDPFAPTPSRPTPKGPAAGDSHVEKIFAPTPGGMPRPEGPSAFPDLTPMSGEEGRHSVLEKLKPSEGDALNRDIAVTASLGPWFVSVMSYVGPEAPRMARQFAMEMRDTYRLQAWVFNHGAEERKKEYERVRAMLEQQQKAYEAKGLPMPEKIRVRYTYTPDQCAVLVGGFPSEEAARRELTRIKALKPPDPRKVKLDVKYVSKYALIEGKSALVPKHFNPKDPGGVANPHFKGFKPPEEAKEFAMVSVNPFERAFIVPNPSVKAERKTEAEQLDIATLRKLNKGEPFNMLECKKPVTLAITQFRTPGALDESAVATGGLFGLGAKKKHREDYAATNANLLAEQLRRHFKLDTYVLHTPYASIVSVGAYDNADDPNLRSMKSLLQARLRIPDIMMFPEPYPMKVPR